MSTPEQMKEALMKIRAIVHTPTSKTAYKTAQDHYQADFDAIRKLCDEALK